MAIAPNDRYPSAQALLEDFKEALSQCEEQTPEHRASSLHRLLSSARLPALGINMPSVHERTEDGTVDAEREFLSSPQLLVTPRRDFTPILVAGFLLMSALSLVLLAYLVSAPPHRAKPHNSIDLKSPHFERKYTSLALERSAVFLSAGVSSHPVTPRLPFPIRRILNLNRIHFIN